MKAEEYSLALITTLKLTEKEINSHETEAAKWKNRMDLAASGRKADLAAEAKKEFERINQKLAVLNNEKKELKEQIDRERRRIPALAASERSIDTDLLEQELLMLLGKTEDEAETEKAFRELKNNNAADAALQALKAKLGADAP